MPRTAYGTARQGDAVATIEYEVPDHAVNESVWDVLSMAVSALKGLNGEDSNEPLVVTAEILEDECD